MRSATLSLHMAALMLAGAVNAFQHHPFRNHTTTSTASTSTLTATATTELPPPPGYTYVTGYPLCNVTGYTEVPADYVETVYQQSNGTLEGCLEACNSYDTSYCLSIAFNPKYNECIFYNEEAQDINLYYDSTSTFDHYDRVCEV